MSIWYKNTDLPKFKKLKGDVKTNTLIIGGGIAGILCAYYLQNSGVDYILTEAETICSGITKNTTAKITSQHGLIYYKLIKKFGIDTAKLYLTANEEAIKKYRELSENIDCDFETKSSFLYTVNNRKGLEEELSALNQLGFNAEFTQKLNLPFKTQGAIRFPNQAQFNPLKFLSVINKDLNIYEHTKIIEISGKTALFEGGKIEAENIIVATHFPFINKHGLYFLKMYQNRSHVVTLENAVDVNGMYLDENENGLSFRNYGKYLLLGGEAHRTGKCTGGTERLINISKSYYPQSKVISTQSTQDCMTLDGISYIGKYSKDTPNLFVATGFNKWGMTTSLIASKILTNMILGKKTPLEEIFLPSRSMAHKQLLLNSFETLKSFVTPQTKRCSHLGCALHWNAQEHSWDCSCHGSRFTSEGRIIDNPATKDLK